jgi:cyclopropane-fatty-acyl-phospholipid synthase
MTLRGEHLVLGDRRFVTGGGLLARLTAPAFAKVLDEIDGRLDCGGIELILPDGSKRRLGFHAVGPAATVHLSTWLALVRLATSGSVGWYKAWTLDEWSSPNPVTVFELFSVNAIPLGNIGRAKGAFRWVNAVAHRLRDNAPGKARKNIAAHYDLGNDFYSAWLDRTMTYSCARFAEPDDALEDAQQRKVRMLLDRLDLRPGQRLLEIGCGWGTLAIEAAKRGASVVGVTLSTEQKAWAEQKIAECGLSDRIEIRLEDYRDTAESFDAVASVEMVEAVGRRWWGAYLDCIARNLKEGGRAALQFIAIDHRLFERYARSPDFIQTYIFPGGLLLHEPQFERLARERGLSWQDREAFGLDYGETLRRWRERYDDAVGRGALREFEDPFHNLWRYYLMYCEGGFRGGAIDVAQVTMVKRREEVG